MLKAHSTNIPMSENIENKLKILFSKSSSIWFKTLLMKWISCFILETQSIISATEVMDLVEEATTTFLLDQCIHCQQYKHFIFPYQQM